MRWHIFIATGGGIPQNVTISKKMYLSPKKEPLFSIHSLEKSYGLLVKDSSKATLSSFTTFWYATIRSWQMKPFEKRTTYLSTKFQATALKRPPLSEMTLKVDTSRLHLQRRKNAEFNTLNETAAAPCRRTTVACLLRVAATSRGA